MRGNNQPVVAGSADSPVDRASLRNEFEQVAESLRHLLAQLSDADWKRQSMGTRWTIGELTYHLYASVLEIFPREIAAVRAGKDFLNPPAFLSPVAQPLAFVIGRLLARRVTLAGLRLRFEHDLTAALDAFDSIADHEWPTGARFYGEGFRSIEALVRVRRPHFDEHAAQIRAALDGS
jgi:hypothetical protein